MKMEKARGQRNVPSADPELQAPGADVFATNFVRRFVSNRGFEFLFGLGVNSLP